MLTSCRGSRVAAILTVLALSLAAALPARACPLCMNSDPALNNPGSQNTSSGQWRISIENKSLSKENGIIQNGVPRGTDHEFQHEDRLTLSFGYQPTMRLGLAVNVPFMFRSHTQYTALDISRTEANDIGDADVQGRYQFWIHHKPGLYVSTSAMGAVVIPTGENNARVGVGRLSEHNQPGTGAWAVMGGLSLQVQDSQRWAYLGAIHKKVWENEYDYSYGHASMLTLEVGQKVSDRLAVLGTTVYRTTATEVANNPLTSIYQVQTGGDLLLVGGGLQVTPMEHVTLRGLAYFPVVNGFRQPQLEDNSLSVSVTYTH